MKNKEVNPKGINPEKSPEKNDPTRITKKNDPRKNDPTPDKENIPEPQAKGSKGSSASKGKGSANPPYKRNLKK